MANNTAELKKFAQSARRQLREQVAARLDQVLTTDSAYLRERESAVKELQQQIALTSKRPWWTGWLTPGSTVFVRCDSWT